MKLLSTRQFLNSCGPRIKSRMASTTSTQDQEVLFQVKNNVGLITLNRPKALNALNVNMAKMIYNQLKDWENTLNLVMVEGSGGKAFCAGGDIRTITSLPRGSPEQCEFFWGEYQLNHLIGNLKIPYVALINGVTMGGGVGLSVHAPFRVATAKTLFAMPETGIGLIPDVGASYVLPRMDGELGTFLALTGQRLKGSDNLHAGIATHACNDVEALKDDLFKTSSKAEIQDVLDKHGENFDEDPFTLEDKLPLIEECFKGDTVEGILDRLRQVNDDWATKTADLMGKMSPTSMKVSLKMVREGREKSFPECLKMEYRLVRRCCEDSDFYEGVRALLVDKDNAPKWEPKTLREVDEARLERYFSLLKDNEELQFT
jgi:3-hydroxyisobutyryl-CoA hydrolase